jgi:alpha-1,2-mannosyltransferase
VLTLLTRGARVFAVLLLADAAVLLLSPSWFRHYGGLTAPPLALCAGIGVQRVAQLLPARRVVLPVLAAGVAAALLLAGLHLDDRIRSGFAVPAAFSAAVDRTPGCVTSDDPTVLESTGLLSRDLADPRCPVWPDVTGWTYDRADVRLPDGRPVPRPRNAIWQRLVLDHLRSGDATIPIRPSTGLSARSRAVLDAGSPLVHVGRFVLRPVDYR